MNRYAKEFNVPIDPADHFDPGHHSRILEALQSFDRMVHERSIRLFQMSLPVVVTNPENIFWLQRLAEQNWAVTANSMGDVSLIGAVGSGFAGMSVHSNPNLDVFERRWEFPKDPFFEYEESDAAWCRYFGFGRLVKTENRLFYLLEDGRLTKKVSPISLRPMDP